MRTRAVLATALLLALLAPAVPASAARQTTVSGRVLDENGRGVASATVTFGVDVPPGILEELFFDLGHAFDCLFSFFFSCERHTLGPTHYEAAARTDGSGRYVLRFDADSPLGVHLVHDVDVTRPALIRGTLPPTTHTTVAYGGERTLPPYRLWLRGASVDKVSTTHRRIRARVPGSLGTPVSPVEVHLVQGSRSVWSYGEVVGGFRTVDARVAETGTTGTQTYVTAKAGARKVTYRSGVRPVTKALRPLSRGRRCYGYRGPLRTEQPGCGLTDGRLGDTANLTYDSAYVDVELGGLAYPEAYVARGCDVDAVAVSVDGVVFLDVSITERERRVYTGRPDLPVRYVRLHLGDCRPRETSVFGQPFTVP
jgi:hypothetical protein